MADRAIEPNPFWDPDFVLPAARALGASNDVALLCTINGDDWAACLPVARRTGWHRVPLRGATSWLHPYCLLGTPLLGSDDPRSAIEAIRDALKRAGGGVSFAALDWVGDDGPVADALERDSGQPGFAFERFSRATLHRRPMPDYLEQRVKGKHRREFRRLARGLEDELGGELQLIDRSGEASAAESFIELESAGWKGRHGTALGANPEHRHFFIEMTRSFAERGRLELLFLEAAGRPAAARCSLLAGQASFCFKVAYDEALSRFSPGRELELRLIQRFHERSDLDWMDSCTAPDNELFNRLWPDRRSLTTYAYPTSGLLGRASWPVFKAAASVRNRRTHVK